MKPKGKKGSNLFNHKDKKQRQLVIANVKSEDEVEEDSSDYNMSDV